MIAKITIIIYQTITLYIYKYGLLYKFTNQIEVMISKNKENDIICGKNNSNMI